MHTFANSLFDTGKNNSVKSFQKKTNNSLAQRTDSLNQPLKIQPFKPGGSTLQPKLRVNFPNDPYEQEADAMSEKVMSMSAPNTMKLKRHDHNELLRKCAECGKEEHENEDKDEQHRQQIIQRKCAKCEEEDEEQKKQIQRKENGTDQPEYSHATYDTLSSAGEPLNQDIRSFMEPRFNYDFSHVRIHNDSLAHQSAGEVNALAYTFQNHVVFGAGQLNASSNSGRKLIAHELTHVLQQTQSQNKYAANLSHQFQESPDRNISSHQDAKPGKDILNSEQPIPEKTLQRQKAGAPDKNATTPKPTGSATPAIKEDLSFGDNLSTFDAIFDREKCALTIRKKINFNFLDNPPGNIWGAGYVQWPKGKAEEFQRNFINVIQKRWSNRHVLVPDPTCSGESCKSVTAWVQVLPVENDEHITVDVGNTTGEFSTRKAGVSAAGSTAHFSSDDVTSKKTRIGTSQVPAEHEFGHMLGHQHVNAANCGPDKNDVKCYGETESQMQNIMGGGGEVSIADYSPFVFALESFGTCKWHAEERPTGGTSFWTSLGRTLLDIVMFIPRLFGVDFFTAGQLRDYLDELKQKKGPSGSLFSDNKARACVSREKELGPFDTNTKVWLIEDMLEGYTSGSDEDSIIALLRRSSDRDKIVTTIGRDRIWSNFSGDNRLKIEALTLTKADAGEALIARLTNLSTDEIAIYQSNAVDPDVKESVRRALALSKITAPVAPSANVTRTGEATQDINGIHVTFLQDTYDVSLGNHGFTYAEFEFEMPRPIEITPENAETPMGDIPPMEVRVKIYTKYPSEEAKQSKSKYGVGTRPDDKNTLQFHERSHGKAYIDFLTQNPPPTFKGASGMMPAQYNAAIEQFRAETNSYGERAKLFALKAGDCVGTLPTDEDYAGTGFTAAICHQQ